MEDLLAGALVLGLVLTGLVKITNDLIFGDNTTRIRAGVCLVLGIAVVQIVAKSDFAGDTVILDKQLDQVNVWSLVIFGILIAGVASTLWQTLGAVRNIGENEVKRPSIKPNDGLPTPQ